MRTKSLRAVLATALFAGTAGTIGYLAIGSASADVAPETVPAAAQHVLSGVSRFDGVAIDGIHRHIAVTDLENGRLVVLNYDGSVAATLDDLPGAIGVQITPDSTKFYVAARDDHAIAVVDTATLTVTKRYALDPWVSPVRLAFVGSRLWFSYGSPTWASLGSIDLADDTVTLSYDELKLQGWWAQIAASPAQPNLLAVTRGDSGSDIGFVDVSGPTAATEVDWRYVPDLSNPTSIAFSQDGRQVIESAYNGLGFAPVDGSQKSTVTANPNTGVGVAVTEAGVMAANKPVPGGFPELYYFPTGSTTATREWDFPNSDFGWGLDQIVWEPGGGHLFAFFDVQAGPRSMWVLDDPTRSATQLTAKAPATAARAAAVTVTGTVDGDLPAGATLSVTRTDAESTKGVALPAVTVAANGAYSFIDHPPAGGTVKYTISYAGDSAHRPATATATTTVTKSTPVMTFTPAGTTYNYGTTVTFTAHLGTWYTNRTVEIWADPYGSDQPNRLLRRVAVDAKGNATATFKLTRNTALNAYYAGDTRYATRTVRSTVYARVSVTTAVTKQYTTSGGYYYFHKTANPVFTTTMTAAAKRKQKLYFEVYSSGQWKPWKSYLLPLTAAGKSTYTLTGTHTVNVKYRVRAAYLNTTSGDNLNYTTYGPYRYFTFRK